MQEPIFWTWNLFWQTFFIPVCLLVLGAWLNYKLKKKDEREEENRKLHRELEEAKAKATELWRQNHTDVMCRVKTKVDGIYEALDNKVDKNDCDRLMGRNRVNI